MPGDAEYINQMMELKRELRQAVQELRGLGDAKARTERDYQKELSTKTLIMRKNGVPATVIQLTVKGTDDVADARFERDVALTAYETQIELINVLKIDIRTLDNQIEREWVRSNG